MYPDSTNKPVVYSLLGAILFHGLVFFAYLNLVLLRPETKNIVISNVDLLVQEKEQQAPKPAAAKTLDFLKLAMPKIPKIEAIRGPKMPSIEIKTPEARRKNFDLPEKLLERSGRAQVQEKLEMDTSKRVAAAQTADLGIKAERGAVSLSPKIELEEIGMRKAPAIPDNLKFDENARTYTPRTMQELNVAVERARKVSALPQGISEKQGGVAALRETARIAPAAPERLAEARSASVENAAGGMRSRPVLSLSSLEGAKTASIKQADAPKKVEIEGPLSKRKVVKYFVPAFASWGRDRGILEASVAVKFYVDNSGRVLDEVSIERSSGYGALDREALDAIKQWRFEPVGGAGSRQWGIITFRFVTD